MTEREIFTAALNKGNSADRAAYLNETCGEDAGLRQRIESLLAEHEQLGSFLEAPSPTSAATIERALRGGHSERPGTHIGPYKLLQILGEGGMGTVYMAEQTDPVQRKVALKVIKAGMDTQQVIARFEAERQALAMMDHVNIARVLDVGTTQSGRPYFVMELVHGVPITKYCDDNHLTPRQRLELFVPVCQAIQHAHQKGIIHRDIKPSNVMITLYDGKPVPKVIDFGVAKAIEQKLTERTLFTQYGTMVGTLEYMSPEQAEMSALGVDTRSDIYSLGVLLYELLTGSTPLSHKRVKEVAYAEILRMIKEDDPPKPSTRLTDSGEALASISAQRHMEPAKLARLIRGELDWIVMKTLEKDRNRRYETANGFAADVLRYLADETVQACPPSAWYRLCKFARRNKGGIAVAATVGVAILMVLGVAAGSLGWVSRDRTTRQLVAEEIVKQALDEADKWQQEQRWPEALAAVKRADSALTGVDGSKFQRRVQDQTSDLEMLLRLEDIRTQVLSVVVAERVFNVEQADRDYARAFVDFGVDVESLTVEKAAELIRARGVAVQLAAALDSWSMARRKSRKDDPGWKHLLAIARATDPEPWRDQFRQAWERTDKEALTQLAASDKILTLSAPSLYLLGSALREIDALPEAEQLLRQAQQLYPDDFWINYELGRSCLRKNPLVGIDDAIRFFTAAIAIRKQSADPYRCIAPLLHEKGQFDEAIAANREALRLKPDYWVVHYNLGVELKDKGLLDEAIASYRESIRIHSKWSWPHAALGAALAEQGKLNEALECYRKAIELDPQDAKYHTILGNALRNQGQVDQAIACYRTSLELDPKFVIAHSNLGLALREQGKVDEAIAHCRTAIELDGNYALAYSNLGSALHVQGKLDEAIEAFQKAIQLDPKLAAPHTGLGCVLQDQGMLDEAIAAHRKAIELDPKLAAAHANLGIALHHQGKLDEAAASLRKAIELNPKLAAAYSNLGGVLHDQGKLEEAIAAHRKAVELDPKDGKSHSNLGITLAVQRKLDEASASFRKAIELDAKLTLAHHNLGNFLAAQGKLDEAIVCFRKATELDPKLSPACHSLASALYQRGKVDEAIVCFHKLVELEPKNAALQNSLAWLLATYPDPKLRDPQRALGLARKAVELQPENGPCWQTLAVAQYRVGDWRAAIVALEKVKALGSPGDSQEWFVLAMAHWQLGEKEEARKWYDQAITWMDKNAPKNEELLRFRQEAAELLGLKDK